MKAATKCRFILAILCALTAGIYLAALTSEFHVTKINASNTGSIDIRAYGARVNGKAVGDGWAAGSNIVSDCVTTSGSTTLRCASSHFAPTDVGKTLIVYGALANGYSLQTTIAAYVSGTQVTMGATAGTTMSAAPITIAGAAQGVPWPFTTPVTCATACGVSAGQWVTFQNANNHIFNVLTQVVSVVDSTHFTITAPNGADPSQPLTSATMLTTSPRVVWGTDDSVAVQAAIDAAATTGGGAVFFPSGITLASGISMPCSAVGFSRWGYTCTHAYNNIELKGNGRNISILENSVISGTQSILNVGSMAWASFIYPGSDWIRGLKIHDLSFRNPLTFSTTNLMQPLVVGSTYNSEIYNSQVVSNSTEGFYLMGNFGMKVHDNTAGPCGLSCYNMTGENEEAYDNTMVVSAQCFEMGSTNSKFHDNFCDFRGRSGAANNGCFNIGSTNGGIWSNSVENNTCIGDGIGVGNVNGMACNTTVRGNVVFDGGISIGTGLDYNLLTNRSNLTTCPTGHGTSTIKDNILIGNLASFGISGGSTESLVMEHNQVVWSSSRCQAGANRGMLCAIDTDCPSSFCGFGNGSGAGGFSFGGIALWAPSTRYSRYSYVTPSVPNGYMYAQITSSTAVTSGTTEPAWCLSLGCTVKDGAVMWTNRGVAATITAHNNSLTAKTIVPNSNAYVQAVRNGAGRSYVQIDGLNVNFPWFMQTDGGAHDGDAAPDNEPPYPYRIPAGSRYDESNRWWSGATPPKSNYWRAGTAIHRVDPSTTLNGWIVTTPGWGASRWAANTAYGFGNLVQPTTANGYVYQAIKACTSGSTAPTWPTSVTVTDGTCTWKNVGAAAVFKNLGGVAHGAVAE
jgi:hypothetical protein